MGHQVFSRDEHLFLPGPKRILCLDGGGLRGLFSLGVLRRLEQLLRQRHGGDPDFRLCHYFDLIAGTSTGAIIASTLALGFSVDKVLEQYQQLGRQVFRPELLRRGIFRARYDERALEENLRRLIGAERTLGSADLHTGLLIVTKRLDSGSPWPLSNNPRGLFHQAPTGADWVANADYPLWKVVRASAAAPSFFEPQTITIATAPGKQDVVATFVDGGVSPWNNPSLQAFLFATLKGYRLHWPTGAERLLLVSVGTGRPDPARRPAGMAAAEAIDALMALMDDCSSVVELLLQSLTSSPTARQIDREINDLRDDLLPGQPLLSYLRYDLPLTAEAVQKLVPGVSAADLASLARMDDPEVMELLLHLGSAAARDQLDVEHFPAGFDLPAQPPVPPTPAPVAGRRPYRRRDDQPIVAVRLDLDTDGFAYRQWGDLQRCKRGDWLATNGTETYSIDAGTFERTYRPLGDGRYRKVTPTWAERASADGTVATKEGLTHYRAGDYLASNEADGGDPWAIPAERFETLYEPCPEPAP
jgi:hypothetical protein